VRADLIYLDGSHEEEDVYQDLVTWWDIVKPGGPLFGDDWTWDGVRLAVQRFASENHLSISHRHDKWELRTPPREGRSHLAPAQFIPAIYPGIARSGDG
jgi:hypothetical protein